MTHGRTVVRRAFTLVEILIVVVILGILAAIVIPQFSNASEEAAASSTMSQLQTLRSQIELYRVKNTGTWPALAFVADDPDACWAPLLVPPGLEEPYLQSAPINPFNGEGDIRAGTTHGQGLTEGWVWDATDHRLYAAGFNEDDQTYTP